MELDTLHVIDYLELMRSLPDSSVDMVLTDIPYGVTDCSWDTPIDLAQYWQAVKRIIKPRGAVVMTATQPLTTDLIVSNRQDFKYSWVWIKNTQGGFFMANKRPIQIHEDVLVFCHDTPRYNPQMKKGVLRNKGGYSKSENYGIKPTKTKTDDYYPKSILLFSNAVQDKLHPTQKPVELFAYLIRTYTNAGDLILDPFCGSGTTAVAAKHEQRHYICGDISAEYIDIARKRVNPTFGEPPKRVKPHLPLSDLPLFEQKAED